MSKYEQNAKKKPKWLTLTILSAVPLIMVLGNSMLIPVLPTIQDLYKISSFQLSLLITLFSIPAAITIPIAGILADRISRKKVIITGLIIYGLGGVLAGISVLFNFDSYNFLLISRIIQGIGAAGTAPIAMVLVSDLYKKGERSKALGVIEASNAMGKVLSPILGSLVALITWFSMFFVFPALCIPVALGLLFFIKEPVNQTKPAPLKEYGQKIKTIFKRQGKWLIHSFFIGAITLFTVFGILFTLSDLLENRFGIDGLPKGFLLAIPLLALCASAYLTGKRIKEQAGKMKNYILTGLLTMALFTALLPLVKSLFMQLTLSSFLSIGAGLILPCLNMLVTSSIGLKERGVITSLYGSVRFLGVALGPLTYGIFANRPLLLYLGSAALLLISAILGYFIIHRPQRIRGKEDRSRLLIRKKRFHPI